MDEVEFDVGSVSDAELDAAWNDEAEATPEPADEQDPAPEADQQKEQEKPAETPAENAGKPKDEPKPDAADVKPQEANQPLTFTLKHMDEVRTVNQDEVVKLAQQGMDYDRIRTERDQLKTYKSEADPALSLVKMYAEQNRMTVPAYVDFIRKQELVKSGVNEQTAERQIAVEKREAALKAQEQAKAETEAQTKAQEAERQAQEQKQKAQEDAKQASTARFLKTYPDVKPDTIPKEVWQSVMQGEDLTTAYTMHVNKKLEADLAAERQNKANAQKSTGSMTTKGAGKQDEIDRWWNDE